MTFAPVNKSDAHYALRYIHVCILRTFTRDSLKFIHNSKAEHDMKMNLVSIDLILLPSRRRQHGRSKV